MTAKEIKDRKTVRLGRSVWVEFSGEQFDLFCEQLCKEQREECSKNVRKWNNKYIENVYEYISNAKQPEL